jgi:anti-sigma regulatory factor (Ser/Thr protein kinase)
LVQIAQAESHDWLENNLVPWLAGRLMISQVSLASIKVCVSELFNNIQDHTRYDIGSIFVQHFPNRENVTIAVSDFGAGIPHNVRTRENLQDAAAIIRAVQDGFTTGSTPRNRGAGLDILLQTVVRKNGGQVIIYSGDSMVRFSKLRDLVVPQASIVGFCPGTTIEIVLRTNTIEVLPEESEDLQW